MKSKSHEPGHRMEEDPNLLIRNTNGHRRDQSHRTQRTRRAVPARKRRSKPSRPKGPRPSSAKRYSHSFLESKGTLKTRGRRRRSAAPPKAPHRGHRLRRVQEESESETFTASNLFAISNRNKMRGRRRTDIIRYAPRMDSADFQRRHR